MPRKSRPCVAVSTTRERKAKEEIKSATIALARDPSSTRGRDGGGGYAWLMVMLMPWPVPVHGPIAEAEVVPEPEPELDPGIELKLGATVRPGALVRVARYKRTSARAMMRLQAALLSVASRRPLWLHGHVMTPTHPPRRISDPIEPVVESRSVSRAMSSPIWACQRQCLRKTLAYARVLSSTSGMKEGCAGTHPRSEAPR